MSCPIKSNSDTIELTMHTTCYCVLDLLCVSFNVCEYPHRLKSPNLSFNIIASYSKDINKCLLKINNP